MLMLCHARGDLEGPAGPPFGPAMVRAEYADEFRALSDGLRIRIAG